jgi:TRAP-type transport system periplasmic protein
MSENVLSGKITRRRALAVGASTLAGGLLAACAPAAVGTAPTQSQAATASATRTPRQKIVLKAGTVTSKEHSATVAFEEFAKLVNQRTNGEVEVQVFPGSQLGSEREMFEGMRLGSVQFAPPSIAVTADWVPQSALFDLPFVFRDADHAQRVYDGEVGKYLADFYPSQGVQVLAYWINGIRNPIGKKALLKPDDVKGLKMRVLQSDLHVDLWRALGANPTPMPGSETIPALQQGTIDFADTSASAYWDSKFFEVAPHFMKLKHIYSVAVLGISKKTWDTLPSDHKEVISAAMKEVAPKQNKLQFAGDDTGLANAKAKGATINEVDQAPWRERMTPVWDKWAPKVGGSAMIQKILDTK